MKAIDTVVENLLQLEETDRSWILERLPAEQRMQLARRLEPSPPEVTIATSPDGIPRELEQRLLETPINALAGLLRKEPPWIVYASLQAAQWPWESAVLEGLPAATQFEIRRLDQLGMKFAPRFLQTVVEILDEKLNTADASSQPRSRWRSFFARLRPEAVGP